MVWGVWGVRSVRCGGCRGACEEEWRCVCGVCGEGFVGVWTV